MLWLAHYLGRVLNRGEKEMWSTEKPNRDGFYLYRAIDNTDGVVIVCRVSKDAKYIRQLAIDSIVESLNLVYDGADGMLEFSNI